MPLFLLSPVSFKVINKANLISVGTQLIATSGKGRVNSPCLRCARGLRCFRASSDPRAAKPGCARLHRSTRPRPGSWSGGPRGGAGPVAWSRGPILS